MVKILKRYKKVCGFIIDVFTLKIYLFIYLLDKNDKFKENHFENIYQYILFL